MVAVLRAGAQEIEDEEQGEVFLWIKSSHGTLSGGSCILTFAQSDYVRAQSASIRSRSQRQRSASLEPASSRITVYRSTASLRCGPVRTVLCFVYGHILDVKLFYKCFTAVLIPF